MNDKVFPTTPAPSAPERLFIHAGSSVETKACGCGSDIEYIRADLTRVRTGSGDGGTQTMIVRDDAKRFIHRYLHSAQWEGEQLMVTFEREALIAALIGDVDPVPTEPTEPRHLIHWILKSDATDTACGLTADGPGCSLVGDLIVSCPDCQKVFIGYKFGRAEERARAAAGSTLPAGMDANVERLNQFRELKAGWDSYNGRPIYSRAIEIALSLAPMLTDWQVVPRSDGNIQFERGFDEIVIDVSHPVDPWEGAEKETRDDCVGCGHSGELINGYCTAIVKKRRVHGVCGCHCTFRSVGEQGHAEVELSQAQLDALTAGITREVRADTERATWVKAVGVVTMIPKQRGQ